MLVYALVASHVDYCNGILYQVASIHLRFLQSVLNAAARLVVKKRKCNSIIPTLVARASKSGLQDLFTHLQMSAPACLSLHHVTSPPLTAIAVFGPRSFSAAGPSVWDSLLSQLKTTSLTIGHFISQLKTMMFIRSYYESAQPS